MSFQRYAVLDPTQTTVVGFEFLDPTSNPDPNVYRPFINTSFPPPTVPGVNTAIQSGWNIGPTSVSFAWTVIPLTAEQIAAYNAAQANKALLNISDINFATSNWTDMTPNQKDALLLRLSELVTFILKSQSQV